MEYGVFTCFNCFFKYGLVALAYRRGDKFVHERFGSFYSQALGADAYAEADEVLRFELSYNILHAFVAGRAAVFYNFYLPKIKKQVYLLIRVGKEIFQILKT